MYFPTKLCTQLRTTHYQFDECDTIDIIDLEKLKYLKYESEVRSKVGTVAEELGLSLL